MKLAYADPPYPGKAYLYPEQEEVDHVALIARLCEYDGWALSTDEHALQYVLGLCPDRVRICAWCRRGGVPPFRPNPIAAWEAVILSPARKDRVEQVWSYAETVGSNVGAGLTGSKPPAFCQWVIRCLGADPEEDTLDDLFPGTGVMGQVWESWIRQPPLFSIGGGPGSGAVAANRIRKTNAPISPELAGEFVPERNGQSGRAHYRVKDRPA